MSKIKQSNDNSAVFFKAATKGDCAKLKANLDAGQKIDARDGSGKTALMRAAEHGHIEAVKILLKEGADAKVSVSDRDSICFGCNALIFAAQSGVTELTELLVDAGSSPKCTSMDGNTPLSFGVEHQSTRMVEVLLKSGARPTDGTLAMPPVRIALGIQPPWRAQPMRIGNYGG